MSHVLVVGNGPASHRLVERLRHHGHRGQITVLGAETLPAYNRVLLSSVLDRTLDADAVTLPDAPRDVRIRLGVTVTEIDRQRRLVRGDDGVVHSYDDLVLATGATTRVPPVPGLADEYGHLPRGVTALRTLHDCDRLSHQLTGGGHAVVLGGGVLGVEAAYGLAADGNAVTLVHPGTHPMDRQLDVAGGRLLADHLRAIGIDLRLGRGVTNYTEGSVRLDDGECLDTEALVLCTGVTPATELADQAGLAVNRGVVVDDHMRTDDPHVHAIGDCVEHGGQVPGLIAPAWDQADVLARVLTGADATARYVPASTVTRLKARGIDLVSIGAATPCADPDIERVTMSDPARGRYATLTLRDERVDGAVLIGFPDAIATISRLHDERRTVPWDRLGLVLGTGGPARTEPADLAQDSVVCRCNTVSKRALADAWQAGSRDVATLAEATRATTGCGGCADDIRALCRAWVADGAFPEQNTGEEGAA
ncbi:NAD(P)/FAD-dependent oxidoreductase [Allosaccharopolyspora coralli]|uniref:NAD(P)/FAD-dependent oxidoreductase n=1 Tax=Allosaccharopolyspora coralli TaxID=2665642 RepID=A0A5Q3Q5X6_9PSEU|nr:FAD-dependent oxidoreductase [Allosaccharopolyspora coralli]QGK69872.1 NAD(P)/FAD-dependent oxidoreductase [Allosaccharopolyspora coralli]